MAKQVKACEAKLREVHVKLQVAFKSGERCLHVIVAADFPFWYSTSLTRLSREHLTVDDHQAKRPYPALLEPSRVRQNASSTARAQEGTPPSTSSPSGHAAPCYTCRRKTQLTLPTVPRQARGSAVEWLAQSHGHSPRLRRLPQHCAGRSC